MNKRLKWLPTVADFMKINDAGEITESEQTVNDITEKLVITDEERKNAHKIMYAKHPVLQIKNLKTKIKFLCLQLQNPSTDRIWTSNINQCLVYNSQFELSSRSYF